MPLGDPPCCKCRVGREVDQSPEPASQGHNGQEASLQLKQGQGQDTQLRCPKDQLDRWPQPTIPCLCHQSTQGSYTLNFHGEGIKSSYWTRLPVTANLSTFKKNYNGILNFVIYAQHYGVPSEGRPTTCQGGGVISSLIHLFIIYPKAWTSVHMYYFGGQAEGDK